MGKILQKTIISLFIGIGIFFALGVNADTFGYETAGTSYYNISYCNFCSGCPPDYAKQVGSYFQAPENGTVTEIKAYLADGGYQHWNFKFGIFNESDGSFEGETTEGITTGGLFAWFAEDASIDIISSNYYWLLVYGKACDTGYSNYKLRTKYDDGEDNGGESNPNDYPNWEEPFSPTSQDRKYSIYATYTAAAAEEPTKKQDVIWFD